MNARQRRKLFASAGLVAMVLGALMVIVPSGAGADSPPTVVRGNQACPAGTTDFKIDPPDLTPGQKSVTRTVNGASVTITYTPYLQNGVRYFGWTSTTAVVRVIVKQGPDSAIFDYSPAASAGTVYVALVPGTSASPAGTSHISFCLGSTPPPPPPATGGITVDKLVDGAGQPQNDPSYDFSVSCSFNGQTVPLDPSETSFALKKDGQPRVIDGLPVGTLCTVTETAFAGAMTTYTVESGASSTTPVTGTVVKDNRADFVVTNTFPAQQARTGAISVDKVVTGTGVPPANTPYTITVSCTNVDLTPQDPSGTAATITLTNLQDPWVETGLPVGSQCTITETVTQGGIPSYTVNAVAGNVATIAADVPQAVVVTNTYSRLPPPQQTPLTFSVALDKANDADGDGVYGDFENADAEGADVPFRVTITNTGTGALTVSQLTDSFGGEVIDLLEDVDLDCTLNGAASELATGTVIPAGGVVVCEFTLEDYAREGGDFLRNTAEVTTDQTPPEDDDSTVITPEVLPSPSVTPASPPPVNSPPVSPKPEVKGVQVTRQLPRTGDESGDLAAFGAGLLLLGAGMVATSRMRFRKVD